MNPYIRPARDVYSWSRLTPLNAVKAVVIGQAGLSSLAFRRANSPLSLVKTHHDASQAHHPGYLSTSPCVNSSGLSSPSCHRRNCPDRSRTSTNSSQATSLPFPLPQQGQSPLSSPCPPLSSRCGHLVHALSQIVTALGPSRDLTPLARAGVLWLNTCLTVRAHKANLHAKKGMEILHRHCSQCRLQLCQ